MIYTMFKIFLLFLFFISLSTSADTSDYVESERYQLAASDGDMDEKIILDRFIEGQFKVEFSLERNLKKSNPADSKRSITPVVQCSFLGINKNDEQQAIIYLQPSSDGESLSLIASRYKAPDSEVILLKDGIQYKQRTSFMINWHEAKGAIVVDEDFNFLEFKLKGKLAIFTCAVIDGKSIISVIQKKGDDISFSKSNYNVFVLQKKLKELGYYKGPIDGVVGSATRKALQEFQDDQL